MSGPRFLRAGADADDVRDLIGDALGDTGLDIVPSGLTNLRLASQGDVKLGAITYDTYLKEFPAPGMAGPRVVTTSGGASLTVNGKFKKP